jgi:NitT/TauT family transport system ATP-binding protein
MNADPTSPGFSQTGLAPVTVGFVPLIDAALLIAAREEGFAAREGLDLRLAREGSWAAVRDKLNAGLFDAAHMLAPAAAASTLGIGHLKAPLTAIAGLNLDGNAITVSDAIAARLTAAAQGQALTPALSALIVAEAIADMARRGAEPLTIGVVFGFSCHLYQVRRWLKLGGIDPERSVRFVVIPPPLIAESLAQGQIDLFCAGAPWNRMAERQAAGRVLHPCAAIIPDCPEKWLVMRDEQARGPEAAALRRAMAAAASWCGEAANRSILARHLARPDYVGAPASIIEELLGAGAPTLGDGCAAPWIRLDADVVEITAERAGMVGALMRDAGHLPESAALDARLQAMAAIAAA